VKGVGGPDFEYGYNIFATSDGGFFTAGTQQVSSTSTQEHFWIARFDSAGNKLWDKSYGVQGITYTLFGSMVTHDDGLMFGGFTNQQFSGKEAAVMYRIDRDGKELWHDSVDYSSSDHFHFFAERREGGYYFGGHTDSKSDPRGNMWLLRLDSARNVIWEKEYDNGSGEHAHWGIETRDGGALLLGHTDVTGLEKFWLVKVDSNGTKQWDSSYSSSDQYHDSPYHVFETREGNYALIGGSSHASQAGLGTIWLVVVDTSGKILIDRHYGNASSESFAWSGRQASDGGFIIAGYTSYKTKGGMDMYVVKTKADGSVEWEKTFGGSGNDYGYDVIETRDGYIAAGYTESASIMTGGGGDLMLVKIAKEVTAPPAATVLISPVNDSTIVASAPTPAFTWQPTPTATKYQLQIATDNAFTGIVYDDSTLTATSATSPQLNAGRYWWHVRAANDAGWGPWSEIWSFTVGIVNSVDEESIASGVTLSRNIPNPFITTTTLRFTIGTRSDVSLKVLDLLGRPVATVVDRRFEGGDHSVPFDGTALPSGTYLCQLLVTSPGGIRQLRTMPITIIH
jgi:hypothetical protein